MKKLLLLLLVITLIVLQSCQKEDIKIVQKLPYQIKADLLLRESRATILMKNILQKTVFDSVRTEPYHTSIYDTCTSENIILDGTERYSLKEENTDGYYFILYEISFEDVVGTGEISGTTYTGGGKTRDVTRIVTTTDSSDINGPIVTSKTTSLSTIRVSYKSLHNSFTFTQLNYYRSVNGEMTIDNTGNPLVETCENF